MWPEPTHVSPDSEYIKAGVRKPYVPARDIVNWSISAPSIFEQKRPLSETTNKRIARRIFKHVINNADPFMIQVNHPHDYFRGQELTESVPTVTAESGYTLVAPTLLQVDFPDNDGKRICDLDDPLKTICLEGNKYAMATAFLRESYEGDCNGAGTGMHRQADTIATIDHNRLRTLDCCNHDVTIKNHREDMNTFLIKYYGQGIGQEVNEPLYTIPSKNRFALITVKGIKYHICDIGLRMLTPRESYSAQDFPTDYEIEIGAPGKKLSKAKQITCCGNSVPPAFAAALAKVNPPGYAVKQPILTVAVLSELIAYQVY